jgi:predicted metal-binding transcription factor (methanogenesis marker protein 9)
MTEVGGMINDGYDDLLLKYINLEADIEMAWRHKLSNSILIALKTQKQEIRERLNQFIVLKQKHTE